jgi:hypothetical protein
VSKEVRRGVVREYGASLFQPATRRETCIAVRIPRLSIRDTTPEDLMAIQAALQPVLAQPLAQRASLCYLVADNDYRRCNPDEFARILHGDVPLKPPRVNTYAVAGEGRGSRSMATASSTSSSPFGMLVGAAMSTDAHMEKNKAKKQGAPAAPGPAAAPPLLGPPAAPASPSLFAPPQAAAPTPPPAPAPVSPLFVQVTAPAPPPPPPAPPVVASVSDPVAALGAHLSQEGFEVLTDVAGLGIHLAAHQPNGKRVIAQHVPDASPDAVQGLAKLCGDLEADVGLLLAESVPTEAWLTAAGTKVVVVPAGFANAWTT